MELLIWAFIPEERARARIDRSESESVPIDTLHSAAMHRTRSGTMSLKKCVFGCEGKITLFSFPKEHSVTYTVDAVVFPGQQWSFSSVFVEEHFINEAQFDAGFAHRLILKDGAGPSYKRSRSWLRTADGKLKKHQMSLFCSRSALKCSSLFSSAHTTRLHSLAPPTRHTSRSSAFFGENRKAVSFFYKYDKNKDFLEIWRMQYYSIGTQD